MTIAEELLKAHMINLRLKKDWSPGEVLLTYQSHVNRLRYLTAMMRADEIINKMMK